MSNIEDFTASPKRRQFQQKYTKWHIPSCIEGHFLGIRRVVELHQEEVGPNVFYYVYNRFFILSRFYVSNVFFCFYLNVFYIYVYRDTKNPTDILILVRLPPPLRGTAVCVCVCVMRQPLYSFMFSRHT